MLKWLIKNSRWVLNNWGQFDPRGFQQEATRQVGGLRALALNELQRKQALQDLFRQEQIKQFIAQQDPMQQLLQRGQAAQAISSIAELGGDVSQFQGLFGRQPTVPTPTPTPMPVTPTTPIGRPTITGAPIARPEAGIEPVTPEVTPTEFQRTAFGGWIPTKGEDIALKREQQKQEAKLKAKAEVLKLSEKARANFGRSVSLFSTMIAQAKGMQEEQREATERIGVETTGLGLVPGIVGGFGVKTRRPWAARTAAFRGQMRETAIGLNSILTGQNRVIRSVVQMIQETLPDPLDPEPMMATKLAQSIMNAYRLVKSFEKAGLSPDKIQQMSEGELNAVDARSLVALYTLSSREQEEINRIIDDVLRTPAMPKRKFERFQGVQPRQTLPRFPREQEFTPEQIEAEIRKRRLR